MMVEDGVMDVSEPTVESLTVLFEVIRVFYLPVEFQ